MTTTTTTTTAIATTTAAPLVTIPLIVVVNALYREALGLVAEQLPTARLPRLPVITPAGVDAVQALATTRDPLTEWLILAYTMSCKVRKFPPLTRRRKVLTGLAKWLRGVPGWVQEEEAWFCRGVMRAVAEATRHTATPAEAAGVYALEMLRRVC